MHRIFLFLLLCSALFSACCDFHSDLQITDQKSGRLGLISAIGLRENAKVSGTLHNASTSCVYHDIALKIVYLNPEKNEIATEILPLGLAVKPGASEQFEAKTQNAPKNWQGDYRLEIDNATDGY